MAFPGYHLQRKSSFKKIITIIVLILILIIGFWFWWSYLYVFGEGVKSGQLNYIVKKGNLFKTYEGKLIQSGIRSQQPGSIQSYEFEFSVENDSLANVLMSNSGAYYDLHYKEYKNTLPWRGFSRYIVDSIVHMQSATH
ncbi:hypothetical protein FC093_19885 [Ilyomonas limi]|uniref:6-phosphogluconate dehydrogenase n=1 Tax=Ilyomonas limi TaxID=2575867 RepID=A0A4U3KTB6_9BACT|nr:hypothetical protein [Ilyomonas limi]TKK65581.1 hypothetical protein FC093_19885 [Ilyomonas limi]